MAGPEVSFSAKCSALARGQAVSLLTAGTGMFASLLSQSKPESMNFPLLLAALNYILCCSYLLRPYLRRTCTSGEELLSARSSVVDDSSFPGSPQKNTASLALPAFSHPSSTPSSTVKEGGDCSIAYGDEDAKKGASHADTAAVAAGVYMQELSMKPDYPVRYIWYLVAAICDCQANYLIIRAFNYTTFTSVALLDAFTIPSAIFLSRCFLDCIYSTGHYIGISMCMVGLICVVLSDHYSGNGDEESGTKSASSKLTGDAMALGGAFLYACSNVLQEYLLKGPPSARIRDVEVSGEAASDLPRAHAQKHAAASIAVQKREEFIGFIGLFGALIAITQCFIFEASSISAARPDMTTTTYLYILGFVACLFFFYTNTSTFLQSEGDAVLFNLSLLTSDIYAVIFTYFNSGHLVHWLYFLGFAFVFSGVYVYHARDPPAVVGAESSVSLDKENVFSNEIASIEKAFAYNPLGGDESESEAEDV